MSAAAKGSIAASLGNLQHLRKAPGPQPVPDTRIPAQTEDAGMQVRAKVRGNGKRSDPRYAQLKAYVPAVKKDAAMKRAELDGHKDFSALVEWLLDEYLRR